MGIRIPPTWPLLLTRFSGPYTNFCHLRRRQRAKAVGGGEGLILFIGETQAQQRHIGVKGQGIVSRGSTAWVSSMPPEESLPRGRSCSG